MGISAFLPASRINIRQKVKIMLDFIRAFQPFWQLQKYQNNAWFYRRVSAFLTAFRIPKSENNVWFYGRGEGRGGDTEQFWQQYLPKNQNSAWFYRRVSAFLTAFRIKITIDYPSLFGSKPNICQKINIVLDFIGAFQPFWQLFGSKSRLIIRRFSDRNHTWLSAKKSKLILLAHFSNFDSNICQKIKIVLDFIVAFQPFWKLFGSKSQLIIRQKVKFTAFRIIITIDYPSKSQHNTSFYRRVSAFKTAF